MTDSNYELGQIIGELKQAVQSLCERIDELKTELVSGHKDHEVRIRALEAYRYAIVGAGAVAGGIISMLLKLFTK